MVSTPSRCSSMMTSLPSSPAPSSITFTAWRIGIAVDRNGLHAQPLQLDDDFLAEFAGAEQHHLHGLGRERRSDAHGQRGGCGIWMPSCRSTDSVSKKPS